MYVYRTHHFGSFAKRGRLQCCDMHLSKTSVFYMSSLYTHISLYTMHVLCLRTPYSFFVIQITRRNV